MSMIKRKEGFTLLEAVLAVAILSIGLLGLVLLFMNSTKANQAAKLRLLANEIVSSEIEQIKTLGYVNLSDTNLTQVPFNYQNSLTGFPLEYQFPGINTNCDAPYNYCLYKGIDKEIEVKGEVKHYFYTIKLSVEERHLDYPTLRRLRIEIFWMDKNFLVSSEIIFMVERK